MKKTARTTLFIVAGARLGWAHDERLHVDPVDVVVDEPVHVRITGVPDRRTVTVRARWSRQATFSGIP